MKKKGIFVGLAISLCLLVTTAAQAITLQPATVTKGALSFEGLYLVQDNNLAPFNDPINRQVVFGKYGFTDRFEGTLFVGLNQAQNSDKTVISGTAIPNMKQDNSMSYGLSTKYLFMNEAEGPWPVSIAGTLAYYLSNAKFSGSVGAATVTIDDVRQNDFTYGVIISKTYLMENWPKAFIPYFGFGYDSQTSSATVKMTGFADQKSDTSETLHSFDVGTFIPLAPDWWLNAEYNRIQGYKNVSTDSVISVGVAYTGLKM